MAEKWTQAFGRYLRTLRERQGLSLQDVASLSQPFAERLTKGYLSRAENGRVRLALSKVSALSHIYKVSAEVLLERIDLDMELDRVGSPETEGMSWRELWEAGKRASGDGYRWNAYAFFRSSADLVDSGSVDSDYRDISEQAACASMACATAAMALGRVHFAHHEYSHVEAHREVGPRYEPLVLERLAVAYRKLGDLDKARSYCDRAIEAAQVSEGRAYLGYTYATRAMLALVESDLALAAEFTKKSHDIFKDGNRVPEHATQLSNLAQIYFDLGRYGAARRALTATESVLKGGGYHRHQALVRILQGEIDRVEHNKESAEARWKEAAQIAKQLRDKTLQFKAEYHLFRLAQDVGNDPVCRSIHRRLLRLANYVPEDTPELQEFRSLVSPSHSIA